MMNVFKAYTHSNIFVTMKIIFKQYLLFFLILSGCAKGSGIKEDTDPDGSGTDKGKTC